MAVGCSQFAAAVRLLPVISALPADHRASKQWRLLGSNNLPTRSRKLRIKARGDLGSLVQNVALVVFKNAEICGI